jgi:hypothetical protein
LAEQLQLQALRNHIKRAEEARQRNRISPEPKRTLAAHAEKTRTRNRKSASKDERTFIVGFTPTTTATRTGDAASER